METYENLRGQFEHYAEQNESVNYEQLHLIKSQDYAIKHFRTLGIHFQVFA